MNTRPLMTTGVLTAAIVAVGLAASPAQAATSKTVSIRTERAGAYFYDYGDELHIGDYKADGYGARAYLTWGSHKASVYTNRGKDTEDNKNLNLPEGTTVWLQLCYTKGGQDVKCSGTHRGIA